jgi:hypothetical protein
MLETPSPTTSTSIQFLSPLGVVLGRRGVTWLSAG